jgi:hypothetical protein
MIDRIIAATKKLFSNTLKMLAGALMFFGAAFTHAQGNNFPRDLTLSWTNASQYEDGTLIEAGDLTEVRFECSNNSQPTVLVVDATVAATGEGAPQSEVFVGVIPSAGRYTCYGYSRVTDGTESAASTPAAKKFLGIPMPPISITVE